MLLGDQEKMHRRLGGDVMKGQHFPVLVDLPAGDFPGNDLTKNTVIHGLYCNTLRGF
jgi:hypothetical protein